MEYFQIKSCCSDIVGTICLCSLNATICFEQQKKVIASLSKSIAVKPFLMKTVSESHLIDDDASSQNGAG